MSQIQDLPTLPKVAERVITLVEDKETSTALLGKAISTDSALSSKILKAANSAYYGLPRKISTVSQASVVLGFKTIKNLVLAASVLSAFGRGMVTARFNRNDFWLHSLGCATICKVLSKETRIGVPEEAFFAGLLHDIGVIVLDQFLHEDFIKILNHMEGNRISIQSAAKELLGVDHNEIGTWLCDKWNFPDHLVESVAFYPTPSRASNNKSLVALVHLGNAIARRENFGHSCDILDAEIDPHVWGMVRINDTEIQSLKEEMALEFDRAGSLIELMKD